MYKDRTMTNIIACDKNFNQSLAFTPDKNEILLLCEKAKEAHTHVETGKRTNLLSKLHDRPPSDGLCPESLDPDHTVLSVLGTKATIKNDRFAVINNRTITLAGGKNNGSFGPNCVLYNCKGVMNLFDCQPNELQSKLDEFIQFRNDHSLEILRLYTEKLIEHKDAGYKISIKGDDTLTSELQHHFNQLVSMYSALSELCKNNNIHEYGLGIQSYCQTWMRWGDRPDEAQFSVMSPHFQTRVFIKDPYLLKFILESNFPEMNVDSIFNSYEFLHNYCVNSMAEYGIEGGGQAFVNVDELHEKENVLYVGGGGGGDTAIAAIYSLSHGPNEKPYIMGAGNSRDHILKYITENEILSNKNIHDSVNSTKRGVSRKGFSCCDATAYINAKIDEQSSTKMVMKMQSTESTSKLDLSLLGNTQYGSLEEESTIAANFGPIYMLSVVGGSSEKYFDSDGQPMNPDKMATEIEKTAVGLSEFVTKFNIHKIVFIDVGLDVTQQRAKLQDFKRDEIVLHSCLQAQVPLEIVGLGPGVDGHAKPTNVALTAEKKGFVPFSNLHFLNILNSRYSQLLHISPTLMKTGRANKIFFDASNVTKYTPNYRMHMDKCTDIANVLSMTNFFHLDLLETIPAEEIENIKNYFDSQLSKRVENSSHEKISLNDILLMGTMFKLEQTGHKTKFF